MRSPDCAEYQERDFEKCEKGTGTIPAQGEEARGWGEKGGEGVRRQG